MRTFFSKLLQRQFLNSDIQAKAFDEFFQELLASSYFFYSQKIQGHSVPCYNLNSQKELEAIRSFFKSEGDGLVLDYGCGLSYLPTVLSHQKCLGLDYSKLAIEYNHKKFPEHDFLQWHLNLNFPKGKYQTIFANDSLYQGKHFNRHVAKILRHKPETLYIVQNFYHDNSLTIHNGYSVERHDFTADFENLVKQWLQILDSEEIAKEAQIYPLIWATITKEMKRHLERLQKGTLTRQHLIFRKK